MENEYSLPCSQNPVNGFCCAQTNPVHNHTSYFFNILFNIMLRRSNLILCCDQRLSVAVSVFPSGWKQLNAVCISLPSHAYHMSSLSYPLRLRHSNGFWSTNYEPLRYAVSCSLLLRSSC